MLQIRPVGGDHVADARFHIDGRDNVEGLLMCNKRQLGSGR